MPLGGDFTTPEKFQAAPGEPAEVAKPDVSEMQMEKTTSETRPDVEMQAKGAEVDDVAERLAAALVEDAERQSLDEVASKAQTMTVDETAQELSSEKVQPQEAEGEYASASCVTTTEAAEVA